MSPSLASYLCWYWSHTEAQCSDLTGLVPPLTVTSCPFWYHISHRPRDPIWGRSMWHISLGEEREEKRFVNYYCAVTTAEIATVKSGSN